MADDTDRALLRDAGLDLESVAPIAEPDGNFCPYTGKCLVVRNPDDPDDSARAERDCFTKSGRLVRYGGRGHEAVVAKPMPRSELRGTLDLWTASSLQLRSQALLDERRVEPAEPASQPLAGLRSAVARHGRIYYLCKRGSLVVVDSIEVPQLAQPQCWRALQQQVGTSLKDDDIRDLRVAEGVVHFRSGHSLVAAHAGTGEHLFTIEDMGPCQNAAVRIAGDRLLLIRDHNNVQELCLYDLGQLNTAHPRQAVLPSPLHRQVTCAELGELPVRHSVWVEAAGESFVLVAADGSVWLVPFDAEPLRRWGNSVGEHLFPGGRQAGSGPPPSPMVSLCEVGNQPHLAFYLFPAEEGEERPELAWLPLTGSGLPRRQALAHKDWKSTGFVPCVIGGRLMQVAQRGGAGAPDSALDVYPSVLGEAATPGLRYTVEASGSLQLDGLQVAHAGGRQVLLLTVRENTSAHVVALDPGFGGQPEGQWRLLENCVASGLLVLWDAAGVYALQSGRATIGAVRVP